MPCSICIYACVIRAIEKQELYSIDTYNCAVVSYVYKYALRGIPASERKFYVTRERLDEPRAVVYIGREYIRERERDANI